MNHFLDIADFQPVQLMTILNQAVAFKQERQDGIFHPILTNKTIALMFEKPSIRTRVSFEVGIHEMGGHSLILKKEDIGLGQREPIKDIARVLSRLVDAVMIRTFDHEDLRELAQYSDIPIINGLTDFSHPCQAMADFLTILEHFGSLEGQRICYLGDDNNVCRSLVEMSRLMGVDIVVSFPFKSPSNGFSKEFISDPKQAIQEATVIYTDTWVSMGEESSEKDTQQFLPYQVNHDLMARASRDAIFLHCLPAHRGEEVTEDVIESSQSKVFDQAENRLHVQKAIIHYLFNQY